MLLKESPAPASAGVTEQREFQPANLPIPQQKTRPQQPGSFILVKANFISC